MKTDFKKESCLSKKAQHTTQKYFEETFRGDVLGGGSCCMTTKGKKKKRGLVLCEQCTPTSCNFPEPPEEECGKAKDKHYKGDGVHE